MTVIVRVGRHLPLMLALGYLQHAEPGRHESG
jgi:hypothetical protein